MAYNEKLAERIRKILQFEKGFDEKKMFGGICYLLHGNMVCGILKNDLIVRVGQKDYADILTLPYTREFDITGRPMKGWVLVSASGIASDKALKGWIEKGISFVKSLPPKN